MAHVFRQFHWHSPTESQSTVTCGSDEGHGHHASIDSDDEEAHGVREMKSTKSTRSTRSKSIKDHALPHSIANITSTVVSSFRKVASAVAGSDGGNHRKVAQCPDSREDELGPLAQIDSVLSLGSSSSSGAYVAVVPSASSSSAGYVPVRQERMAMTLSEDNFQKHIQTMPFFGVIKSQLQSLASKRKHLSSASLEEDIRHLCLELANEIRTLTVQEAEDKRKHEKAQFMREITALRDQCLARPKILTETRKQDIQYYGTLNELSPAQQELVSSYADELLKTLIHEVDLNPDGELAQRIGKIIGEERGIFKDRLDQLDTERDELERELQGAKTALEGAHATAAERGEDCERFRRQALDLEKALAQQRQAAEVAERDRLAAKARLATVQRALGEARRVLRTEGGASGGDELASDTSWGEDELGCDMNREAGSARKQEVDGAGDDAEDGRGEEDEENADDAEEDADGGDDEDDGGGCRAGGRQAIEAIHVKDADVKTTTFTTIEQTTSVTSTTTTVVETTTSACGDRRRQSDAASEPCGHDASRPPLPGASAADWLRYSTSIKDLMVQEASSLRHAVVFIGTLGRFEEKFYAELLQEAGTEGSRAPTALTRRFSSARKECAGLQQLCATLLEAFDDALDIAGAGCTAAAKVGRIRKRLWAAHATSKANLLQLHADALEEWRGFVGASPEEKAESGPVSLSASPSLLSTPSASQVSARCARGSMAVKSQGSPSASRRPTVLVPASTMILFDGESGASPARGLAPSRGAAAAAGRESQLVRPYVVNTAVALPQIVPPMPAKTVFLRSQSTRKFAAQTPPMPASPRGRKTLTAEDDAVSPSTPRGQSPCSPVASTKARPLGTRH